MRYKNIILSLYGTLVDISTNENDPSLWEALSEFFSWQGGTADPYSIRSFFGEEVRRALSDARLLHPQLSHVDIDILKVFEALYRRIGLDLPSYPLKETAEFFREKSTRSICLRKGSLDLLDRMEEEGCRIFLLVNGQSSFSLPEIKRLGISDYLEEAFFSSDYRMAKPEKDFFDLVIKGKKLEPDNTVMVGSSIEEDITGAKAAKIDSIYVNSSGDSTEGLIIPSVLVVKNGDLAEAADYILE